MSISPTETTVLFPSPIGTIEEPFSATSEIAEDREDQVSNCSDLKNLLLK
jgi:hypothetical protein